MNWQLWHNILMIALMVFGFGFVVFWHELGHFLAAKWVGIKVEQFAVGFGQAIFSWRKGIGVRVGSTHKEFDRRVNDFIEERRARELQLKEKIETTPEQFDAAAKELGLGETEYRLNWMPLGGYVKMLGQDDMNPNAQSDDPRAYNRRSIGARMFVVSAGVIMNVILAFLLFVVLFWLLSFRIQPTMIGSVQSNSPAQLATPLTPGQPTGLQVGDRIRYFDGKYQHSFDKLLLNTALSSPGHQIPVKVERNGQLLDYELLPQRGAGGRSGTDMLLIGVTPMHVLRGLPPEIAEIDPKAPADPAKTILPGDVVIEVAGTPVNQNIKIDDVSADDPRDYITFDQRVQSSGGKPVPLKVRGLDGKTRTVMAEVTFGDSFGETPFNIAGLTPRVEIAAIGETSVVKDILRKGDVVTNMRVNGEPLPASPPTYEEFIRRIYEAGEKEWKVEFEVQRDGAAPQWVGGAVPTVKVPDRKRGVGIQPTVEVQRPVVAGILDGTPASRADLKRGARILKVDGQDVSDWFEVVAALRKSVAATGSTTLTVADASLASTQPAAAAREVRLEFKEQDRQALASIRYAAKVAFRDRIELRHTGNPIEAAGWGVEETRDMLLQFYVTIHRLTQGSVPVSNVMGPLGIVTAGSMFAMKGPDWLVWFLAMISANLAVVNFLPIPIVDGGLFLFLILEKIMGRPLSPRMQTVAQLVGLALILSVFVFATYNDIARMWM